MEVINFEQYKPKILAAIESKLKIGAISDPNGFILIDGFINMPLQKEMGGAFVIGGPTVPAVAVVGKSTGLIYTFALKVLIPDIQL
jgi:hypothetical protein